MAIPASNNLSVNHPNSSFDFADPSSVPTGQTTHGFGIFVDGVIIGRILSFTLPAQSRSVVWTRELNPATAGQPVDIVPGGEQDSSFTFTATRAEVWNEEIEKAFGETNFYTLLIDQRRSFKIVERYKKGDQTYKEFTYLNCWVTSKSTTSFDASMDDPRIIVDLTIAFGNKIKTFG
jgi:hypothetical protein